TSTAMAASAGRRSGRKGWPTKRYMQRKTEIAEERYFPNSRPRFVLFDEVLDDYREAAAGALRRPSRRWMRRGRRHGRPRATESGAGSGAGSRSNFDHLGGIANRGKSLYS